MTPRDIKIEGRKIGIPGFRRIQMDCCAGCDHHGTNLLEWVCAKHKLVFGSNSFQEKPTAVDGWTMSCEFKCDDYKCDVPTPDISLEAPDG